MISRLSDQLSLELQPALLFAHPTARDLAARLDQLLDEALAPWGRGEADAAFDGHP